MTGLFGPQRIGIHEAERASEGWRTGRERRQRRVEKTHVEWRKDGLKRAVGES